MKYLIIIVIAFAAVFLLSRGCNSSSSFSKTPVDELIRDMSDVPSFTIILYDMDEEGFFSKTYKHKYQIVREENGEPKESITGWHDVNKAFFGKNVNNMGMEIAAKKDGKVTKKVSPPGYSNYIGNSRYGQWRTRSDGSSFWEFYGKYAMMSSMFNLMSNPVRRSYWNDYYGNYYGRRAYYGPTVSGRSMYGTGSRYNSSTYKNSRWSSKASRSSFSDKVRNRVSPSSSRTTRSSSRYKSSSSSRSRSGGFGK